MKPYYEEAGITIYHGDCREVLGGLPDGCAEIVVTSPPYNLVKEWVGGGANSKMKNVDRKLAVWYADEIPELEYQNQQKDFIRECLRVSVSSVFYNHKVRYAYRRRGEIYHPLDWLREFPIWTEIIWDRGGAQGGNSQRVLVADERIYQIRRPVKFNLGLGYTTVWRIRPDEGGIGHVCPFPEQLVARCIALATGPDDVVLDPYCGSGTTLRVAKNMGRQSIGCDIDERSCEIAANRLRQSVLEFA